MIYAATFGGFGGMGDRSDLIKPPEHRFFYPHPL
jgi:hypothetical protein